MLRNITFVFLYLEDLTTLFVIWYTHVLKNRNYHILPNSLRDPKTIQTDHIWHKFLINCPIFNPKPLLESPEPPLQPQFCNSYLLFALRAIMCINCIRYFCSWMYSVIIRQNHYDMVRTRFKKTLWTLDVIRNIFLLCTCSSWGGLFKSNKW